MEIVKRARGLIAYMAIWFLLLLWFWIGLPADGAMGYSIISFYLALPISSFVISCIWGRKNTLIKWTLPAFFGCMEMLLSYFTFAMANTMAFHNQHIPDIKTALVSAVPSLVGLCIGIGITALKKTKAVSSTE